MKLFELCGEEGFDLMMAVVERHMDIAAIRATDRVQVAAVPDAALAVSGAPARMSSSVAALDYSSSSGSVNGSSDTHASSNSGMNTQEMEDASLALAHQLSSDLQMQDAMETAEAAADYAGLSANQRKKVDKQRQREAEKQEAQKRAGGGGGARDTSMDWLLNSGFERAYIEQERALGLPSRAGNVDTWKEGLAPAGTLQYREKKASPKQVRTQGLGYEQIFLPAPAAMATATSEELVDISDLETWAQLAFPGH